MASRLLLPSEARPRSGPTGEGGLGASPRKILIRYFRCSEANFGSISGIDRLGCKNSVAYYSDHRKIVTDSSIMIVTMRVIGLWRSVCALLYKLYPVQSERYDVRNEGAVVMETNSLT